MSILWRIFLSFWFATSVILAVVMFASFQAGTRLNDSARTTAAYDLIDEADRVVAEAGEAGLVDWLGEPDNFPPGIALYVLTEDSVDLLGRDFPGFLWPRSQEPDRVRSWADFPTRRPTLTAPDGTRYMPIVGPETQPALGALGLPSIQWLVLLSAILASGLVGLLLAKPLKNRLMQLAAAANALSKGDLDARVDTDAHDEIGVVGQQFDRMAATLQHQIQSRQEFFRNVSHEMRSPLARIKLALELAEHDPDRMPEQVDRIRSETAHLERMMTQVLDLARMEDSDRHESLEPVDLAELLDIVISDARFEGEALGQRVEWSAPEGDFRVLAHMDLLRSAIENVVRNAICHTESGTVISIDLRLIDGKATIDVQDSATGVAKDLDKIFEPFFRGDSTQTKGSGIGLAISRRAIELMKGSIRAVSPPGSGLKVSLSLPLIRPGLPHPT